MFSKDPIKRGLNPYPYCDNNPVDYVDPTGEVANVLLGGGIGGLIGGVSGFVSSAVSQLTSGQGFSMKKALGSAANGAVVGAVQGALVSSGAGLVTSLISNFAAGTAGNALEQGIGTGRVNVAESITSGATNAVSNLIYGNAPLKNVKSAFLRGAGSGAATSAINSLSNNLTFRDTDKDSTGAGLASVMASGITIPYVKVRNPRTICEVSNPFDSRCGYQNTYGYQYEVRPINIDTNTNAKKGGFNLGSFIKDVTIGAVTGGLSSVAFYGAGKAVDALKDGVRNRGVGTKKDTLLEYNLQFFGGKTSGRKTSLSCLERLKSKFTQLSQQIFPNKA